MSNRALNLALLCNTQGFHAKCFAGVFNSASWGEHARAQGFAPMPLAARVTRVWDARREDAQKLAAEFGIDRVCSSAQEALDGADGAMLVGNGAPAHTAAAPLAIASGVPFFLDKPAAPTLAEAQKLFDLAGAAGALMFSGSALRFSRELAEARPKLDAEGGVKLGIATAPNGRIVYYGIHAVELLLCAMGPGVVSVEATGRDLAAQLRLEWADGRTGLVCVDQRVRALTGLLHTARAAHYLHVADSKYYYWHQMRALVWMIVDRAIPVPWSETLEVARCLDRAQAMVPAGA